MTLNYGLNAVGQSFSDISRRADESAAGLCVDSSSVRDRTWKYSNTGRSQVQSVDPITVGGPPADGDTITITVAGNSPVYGAFSEDVVATFGAGETNDTAAAKVAASINSNEVVNDLIYAEASGADVQVTIRPFQEIDSIAGASTGTATVTAAPTLTAKTTSPTIPFGYVVARYPGYSEGQCSNVFTATDLIIVGVAEWNRANQTANYPYENTLDGVPMGYRNNALVCAMRKGPIWVPAANAVEGTLAQIDPTNGQIVANGTAGAIDFLTPGDAVFRSNSNSLGHAQLSLNIA